MTENVPRILPKGLQARIKPGSWPVPAIMKWLEKQGRIPTEEMYRVFNMGIGMTVIVDPAQSSRTIEKLNRLGETAFQIGKVMPGDRQVVYE